MRTVARDFPEVIGAISDVGVRALFSQRFLVATEIYDELVNAACLRILEDVGREFSAEEELPVHTRPAFHYILAKLTHAGFLRRVNASGAAATGPAAPNDPSPLHLLRKNNLTLAGTEE